MHTMEPIPAWYRVLRGIAHRGFVKPAGLVVAALACAGAMADTYPSRPISLVVPFAAGSSGDAMARRLAQALKENHNATVVVENRSGAGGVLGIEHVARAKPDGYTLLLGSDSLVLGPLTRKSVSFSLNDFVPIARLRVANVYLAAHSQVPVDSVAALVQWAKAKPGQLRYASTGASTITHLAAEQFTQQLGLDMVHVPYRGATQSATAAAAGEVEFAWTGAAEVAPMVAAGKVRVLGMLGRGRSPALPSVPTMAELGHEDLWVVSWHGVFAPAGTPPEALRWLDANIPPAALSPSFQKGAEAMEVEPGGVLAGPEFQRFLAAQRERYQNVIRRGNIQLLE
jgi:tripartite-type tricarboxylate transporter receptor subunit TctC